MTVLLAVAAGALIGLSLGALGGGGSILAVPVLVYLLDQSPSQATTGSLVVVGVTALVGTIGAARAGHVMLARGAVFGGVAIVGAAGGAKASVHVPEDVLLACFSGVLLLVGAVMTYRLVGSTSTRTPETQPAGKTEKPIITFSPAWACQCPRALKVVVTATGVGFLTGFLGVGGGFLVVPALVIALSLPLDYAVGTSLVVIALTSAAALAVRTGVGVHPDWTPVVVLTLASSLGALAGARLADHSSTARLSAAFTALVVVVATYTATQALPALL